MASILCSKCNHGIHYHGEPNGIQYVMINKIDWNVIVSSKFDSKNKVIDPVSGYPKLYRTDTIEDDFPGMVKKFWKCPSCGSLHFFNSEGTVLSVYEPENSDRESCAFDEFIGCYFDDYKWEELTENAIPNFKLSEELISFNEITIYQDKVIMRNADTNTLTTYKILK